MKDRKITTEKRTEDLVAQIGVERFIEKLYEDDKPTPKRPHLEVVKPKPKRES